MSKTLRIGAVAALGTLLVGCESNPTFPDLADDLHAELEFSVQHLSTLTDIEVEVRVHSDAAGTFTDFDMIAVEFRQDGDTNWRATELELHQDHFSGAKMFFSSGDYEARVVAQATGSQETLILYQSPDHLHVERIHQEVGDYIVEFETFPGHMHEGDQVEVSFWVLEASTDGHGHGHAVGSLSPDIVCTDNAGVTEEHAAHEHQAGEYGAEHIVTEAGSITFELHFTDGMGMDHHAQFTAPVSHAH